MESALGTRKPCAIARSSNQRPSDEATKRTGRRVGSSAGVTFGRVRLGWVSWSVGAGAAMVCSNGSRAGSRAGSCSESSQTAAIGRLPARPKSVGTRAAAVAPPAAVTFSFASRSTSAVNASTLAWASAAAASASASFSSVASRAALSSSNDAITSFRAFSDASARSVAASACGQAGSGGFTWGPHARSAGYGTWGLHVEFGGTGYEGGEEGSGGGVRRGSRREGQREESLPSRTQRRRLAAILLVEKTLIHPSRERFRPPPQDGESAKSDEVG